MNYALILLILLVSSIATPAFSAASEKTHLTLVAENGERFTVGSSSDKEFFLLFMSFNCNACRNALPTVDEIEKKVGTKGRLVGVIFPPEEKDLPGRAKELKITFPLVRGSRELAQTFAIEKTPTLIWFDRKGQIREKFIGDARLQQLQMCLGSIDNELCSGLIELTARPAEFVGRKIVTSGLLVTTNGKDGKAGTLYLSNGKEKIEVLPWAPQGVAPEAPVTAISKLSKKTESAMQQFVGKLVTLHGSFQAGSVLKVESATIQEKAKTWKRPERNRP